MNRVVAVIAGMAGLWFFLLSIPRDLAWSVRWLLPEMAWGQLVARRSGAEAWVAFCFAAILLVFAYRRFRASPGKGASYVGEDDGAWRRLKVTPATPPVLWFPAVLSVVMGAGVASSGGIPYLWVLGLIFALLAGLVLLMEHRGGNPAAARSFRVSPDGIETGDAVLRRGDIHKLNIRNKFAGNIEVVYDARQGMPTGTAMGLAGRRALAEVAYRVEVEAGGKAYVLAAGLDEATARGLVAEVGNALKPSAATS